MQKAVSMPTPLHVLSAYRQSAHSQGTIRMSQPRARIIRRLFGAGDDSRDANTGRGEGGRGCVSRKRGSSEPGLQAAEPSYGLPDQFARLLKHFSALDWTLTLLQNRNKTAGAYLSDIRAAVQHQTRLYASALYCFCTHTASMLRRRCSRGQVTW